MKRILYLLLLLPAITFGQNTLSTGCGGTQSLAVQPQTTSGTQTLTVGSGGQTVRAGARNCNTTVAPVTVPDPIAFYDIRAQMGFDDSVNISSPITLSGAARTDLYYAYQQPVVNGWIGSNAIAKYTATSVYTQASGTNTVRQLRNIVVANSLGIFNPNLAVRDTFDLFSDTLHIRKKAIYGGEKYTWHHDSLHFFASTWLSSLWIDTTKYSMVNNDYYVIDIEYRNQDTVTRGGAKLQWTRSDASGKNAYVYSTIPVADKSFHRCRLIFQHKSGTYYSVAPDANTAIIISNMYIHHISNSTECVFSYNYFKSRVFDKLGNYDPILIDTTNLIHNNIISHFIPTSGYSVRDYLVMNRLNTTLNTQTDNGNNVDLVLNVTNTGMIYNVGDTILLAGMTPEEFNGYKKIKAANTTTITLNQRSDATCTDGAGTVQKADWNYGNLIFPADIKSAGSDMLVIYGTNQREISDVAYIQYSRAEGGSAIDSVAIFFDWTKVGKFNYYDDNEYHSNNILGFVIFDTTLSGPQKYIYSTHLSNVYKKHYAQVRFPQLNWSFDGYWPERIVEFRADSRMNNFAGYERDPAILQNGNQLIMSSSFSGTNGYLRMPGPIKNYEFDCYRRLIHRTSSDFGASWTNPVTTYVGRVNLTTGDTVGIVPDYMLKLNDDSLLQVFTQFNNLDGVSQRQLFLKIDHNDLTKYRLINPFPNDSGFGNWNGANGIVLSDSIYVNNYTQGSSNLTAFKQYMLASGDNGNNWMMRKSGNYMGEASIVNNNGTWLMWNREGAPKHDPQTTHIESSVNRGLAWSAITPTGMVNRFGIGTPVGSAKLSNGNIWVISNYSPTDSTTSNRAYVYFIKTRDGINYTNATPIWGGQYGYTSYPNWSPVPFSIRSYFDIVEDTRGNIHISSYDSNISRIQGQYLKLSKKQ